MNLITILGILCSLVSAVGLLIISAKYGIRSTLDTYTGRDKQKVLNRIQARKRMIGAEQTMELVEKFTALDGVSRTGSLKSATTNSLTSEIFKNSDKLDNLLDTLMRNNASSTTSLVEGSTPKTENIRGDEVADEQTGLLVSDKPLSRVEVEEQQLLAEQVKDSIAFSNSQCGIFRVTAIYDNIEL
jgi:hypothetical protein